MFKKIIVNLLSASLIFSACKNNDTTTKPANNIDTTKQTANDSVHSRKNILFFGNSLTAGYGLDPSEAFPALIQRKIDSMHFDYKVINGGLSGETTAGGKSRVDWLLEQRVDIFILELGGNDGLRGIPVTESVSNLQAIIDKVRSKYPSARIILVGMQVPPNMGNQYAKEFKAMYPALAEKNKIELVPFLLEGVGGVPNLNQADGIHPIAEGHKIVAENVWTILKSGL